MPRPTDPVRRRVLDATRRVFIRVGSRGLGEELLLAESGLDHATFATHFADAAAALEALLQDLHERLLAKLLVAVADLDEPVPAVEAGLLAFRQWSEELGPLLGPLQAEKFDPASPVSRHRRDALDFLALTIGGLCERFDRPRPTRLLLDAALQGLDYLGFRYALESPRDDAAWKHTRDAMLRLALGLLGTREEWARADQLADALRIDLAPRDPAPQD
jgi:AcrR family transcriptional regulator